MAILADEALMNWGKKLKNWLRKKPESNGEDLVNNLIVSAATAVGVLLIGAISTVILTATDAVDLESELPIWLFVAALPAAVLVGGIGGALWTRFFYFRRRVEQASSGAKDAREEASRKVEEARKQVEEGEAKLRQTSLYSVHVGAAFDQIYVGEYQDFEQDILEYAARTIKTATGHDVCLAIVHRSPQKLGISAAPQLNEIERRAFEVPLASSWINLAWADRDSTDDLLGMPDLSVITEHFRTKDLSNLAELGYFCLSGAVINGYDDHGQERCLIALCKEANSLTKSDALYLRFLSRLLSYEQLLRELRQLSEQGAGDPGA